MLRIYPTPQMLQIVVCVAWRYFFLSSPTAASCDNFCTRFTRLLRTVCQCIVVFIAVLYTLHAFVHCLLSTMAACNNTNAFLISECTDPVILRARHLLADGQNVALMGCSGTGKSTITANLIKDLRGVAITGSTGVAASLIGGVTLHSWAGLSIRDLSRAAVRSRIAANPKLQDKLRATSLLVIDEVSMISARVFEDLNTVMKFVKKSDLPFGGLQLLVVGDLLQLPPVNGEWVFTSNAWQRCDMSPVILQKVHRTNDKELISCVKALSHGQQLTEIERRFLESLRKPAPPPLSSLYVFGTNTEVDSHNMMATNEWPGNIHVYKSVDEGRHCCRITNALETLYLKEDMPVIVTYNINVSAGVVNGAVGTVSGLHSDFVIIIIGKVKHKIRKVRFTSTSGGESRTQLPLKPAFASTVHRLQGQTITRPMYIDCRHIKSATALAVAIGRAQTSTQLYLSNLSNASTRPHPNNLVIQYLNGNYEPVMQELQDDDEVTLSDRPPPTASAPNPWDRREPAVALRPIPIQTIADVSDNLVSMFSATLWCMLCTIDQEDAINSKKDFQKKTLQISRSDMYRNAVQALYPNSPMTTPRQRAAAHQCWTELVEQFLAHKIDELQADQVVAPVVEVVAATSAAKLRYISGWVVFRARKTIRRKVSGCLKRNDKRLPIWLERLHEVEGLCVEASQLRATTNDLASLRLVDQKNNENEGLIHITDLCLTFFTCLESARGTWNTQSPTRTFPTYTLDSMKSDDTLKSAFKELLGDSVHHTYLFDLIVTIFHKTAIREYRKKLKSSIRAKKALRIQIRIPADKRRG